jgi:folate-binding protein YgfZ
MSDAYMQFRKQALRLSMIALPYLHAARVTGADAGQFLHAQFSADIAALADGQSTFCCYCTPKGKVIAVLQVCRSDADYFLIASSELLPGVLQRLQMFVLRADVSMELLADHAVFGLNGSVDDGSSLQVFTPAGLKLEYAIGQDQAHAPGNGDSDTWRYQEVEQGVPWLDNWTTERFLPQMLGAEKINAVSFSKGCYPGQEIVARTRYLATLKRKPLRLVLNGRPAVRTGDRVCLIQKSGESEGVVIEIATSDDGREILFIVARHNTNEVIETLRWGEEEFGVLEIIQAAC